MPKRSISLVSHRSARLSIKRSRGKRVFFIPSEIGLTDRMMCSPERMRYYKMATSKRRFSPDCRKIINSLEWQKNGFVPSYELTAEILIKASRRTYELFTHSSE